MGRMPREKGQDKRVLKGGFWNGGRLVGTLQGDRGCCCSSRTLESQPSTSPRCQWPCPFLAPCLLVCSFYQMRTGKSRANSNGPGAKSGKLRTSVRATHHTRLEAVELWAFISNEHRPTQAGRYLWVFLARALISQLAEVWGRTSRFPSNEWYMRSLSPRITIQTFAHSAQLKDFKRTFEIVDVRMRNEHGSMSFIPLIYLALRL